MKETLPLILATGLYLWQTINFMVAGNRAMALVFVGYSFANVGLVWAAQRS